MNAVQYRTTWSIRVWTVREKCCGWYGVPRAAPGAASAWSNSPGMWEPAGRYAGTRPLPVSTRLPSLLEPEVGSSHGAPIGLSRTLCLDFWLSFKDLA